MHTACLQLNASRLVRPHRVAAHRAALRHNVRPVLRTTRPLNLGRVNATEAKKDEASATSSTAAEEQQTTTNATAGESTSNGTADPFTLAKELLAAEVVDKEQLEAVIQQLEQQTLEVTAELTSAQDAVARLEAAQKSSRDALLRLSADFDNFRRRTAAEKEGIADGVRGDVIQQLLPLVDNFELARTQVKAETEAEQKINNSYQGLYKQMVDLMRGLGIEAVPTVGAPFNPEIHEAIMREPSNEVPDDTVLLEFRKGFRLGEKLLRPAVVKVSFREEAAASS